jgi:ferredoxin
MTILSLATLACGAALTLLLLWTAAVSRGEQEPRATRLALLGALLGAAIYGVAGLLRFAGDESVQAILVALPGVGLALWALPLPGPRHAHAEATTRIDERTVLFSRMVLEPGTPRFDAYYAEFPAHRAPDDRWRAKPGLLDAAATHAHRWAFGAAAASFAAVEPLRTLVDGEPAAERVDCDPADMARFLKGWAVQLGAITAGVTELRDEHWYAVIGRREPYGADARLPHTHALVFTVEMDKTLLDAAPGSPAIMESAAQYVRAGVIAVQAAQLLRSLGWSARAHIDGDYRVVCPLVARDAGLGEIGRMGLLMTPELGPRVRLAVVTTDLPLAPDAPTRDAAVLDFCTLCEKCADVCPSAAIPHGPRVDVDGVLRWQIDQEECFTYWCIAGTDCGRCVQTCPYSHPDNLLHRLVRRGVDRSAPFRRAALWMDDAFYGRRPPSRELPAWIAQDVQG